MPITKDNNGPSTLPATDESLIPNSDTGSRTVIQGGQAGVEDSVSDFNIFAQDTRSGARPDLSLASGSNPDNGLNLSNINFLTAPIKEIGNFLGDVFNLDDIAEEYGFAGFLGNAGIPVNTNVQPKLDPRENVLHQYASYTYRISMGAQSVEEHREIAGENYTEGRPKMTTLMMASGGDQCVDDISRDPIFEEDFYIEDLKMHTILGSNAQGNGSNTVNIEFSIFEPNAVSLIERLLALANKLGYENYIEIPFVFKIEFIGYDDEGNRLGFIPQTTKYIPFRLTYMRFKIKGSGVLYHCDAIPYNHITFNQSISSIPEAVEVAAGNVGEFFNGKQQGESTSNTTGGLVNVINGYHKKLTMKTGTDSNKTVTARSSADKISIFIHPDIARHALTVGNLSKVGMLSEAFDPSKPSYINPGKPTYGFNAGTHVTAIIEQIIKNSSFYLEQIEEAERIDAENSQLRGSEKARAKKKKPFIDFSITSTYELLEYDEKANRHAYKASFFVEPKEKVAMQSSLMGRQQVENVAKDYEYLFTGQNQDILDIDLKFDLAFYNNVSTNTESSAEGTPAGSNKRISGSDQGNNLPNNSDPIMKARIEHSPHSAVDNTGTATKEDRKKMKAADFRRSIMQDSEGDMITFDLSILGDPAFIKQDDILFRVERNRESPYTENGSIKTDPGDLYIRLRFKVFDDINHENGLRFESRQIPDATFARKSTFDGFYRVVTLENVFQKGNFTQNLVVQRTYVQEEKEKQSAEDNKSVNSSIVKTQDLSVDEAFQRLQAEVTGTEQTRNICHPGLTASQSVTEQRSSGDANRPSINRANVIDDDTLGNVTVDAESIVTTTTAQATNADR